MEPWVLVCRELLVKVGIDEHHERSKHLQQATDGEWPIQQEGNAVGLTLALRCLR